MTFNEIVLMIHNACCKVFNNGTAGSKDAVIQCATQIYIAQMQRNEGNKDEKR